MSSSMIQGSSSSSCSTQQQQEENHPPTQEAAWEQAAAQRGLSRRTLYVTKKVTTTDARKDQNRYELGLDDFKASMPMLELAIRSHAKPSQDVMVLDEQGREYTMIFKFIESNRRYRFIGSEWGRFMRNNDFQPDQIMRIYGLADGRRRNWGFAFVNKFDE